jgi:glycosyltransferase involved in cell wall biosynthesis
MPAFNAEKYISEAIESILNQTLTNFELIIADDHSTDQTWQIIQNYAKKDVRIKIFRNTTNLYIAGNRNFLLKKAQGKYVVWQDADDISFPDRLTSQYEYLETHPGVGIVGGTLVFFNEKGQQSVRKYAENDASLRGNIFLFSPIAQPGAMILKEALDYAGEYDLRFPPAEDIDMSFRIGRKFKFANLQKPVIKYRENNTSATFIKLRTIELNSIKIRFNYAHGHGYTMSPLAFFYNVLQYISAYIVPSNVKIWLFNRVRNSK